MCEISYSPGVAVNAPQASPAPMVVPIPSNLQQPGIQKPLPMNPSFSSQPPPNLPLPQPSLAAPSVNLQQPGTQQPLPMNPSFTSPPQTLPLSIGVQVPLPNHAQQPPASIPLVQQPPAQLPFQASASFASQPTSGVQPLNLQMSVNQSPVVPNCVSSPVAQQSPTSPSQKLSPQMIMLLAVVKQARLYAVAAVQADMAGDYPSAAANYRAAVKSLKNEVANVPPEDSQAFNDRIVMYERRAELIELMKLGITPEKEDEHARLPYVRPTKESFPDPLPDDDASRTFWLFRVLIKTLTTGGFIAPRIFVPRDVWYAQLPSVRLDQLPLKCGACFTILEYLQKLQQIADFKDSSLIAEELQQFCETLNTLQMLFAEKLPYITGPHPTDERVLKQVKKNIERESGTDDIKKYAQALTNVMKEVLFLEKWVEYYATIMSAAQINTLLASVLSYFQGVFCPVVLSDLRCLLSKYMRRFEEQIVSTL